MSKLYIVLVTILSTALSSYGQKSGKDLKKCVAVSATHRLTVEDIENLPIKPECLKPIPDIDRVRIGGGFVAAITAARYPEISSVFNKFGPIVPVDEENNFNIACALQSRGYADSPVNQVMPLWQRHYAAWAQANTASCRSLPLRLWQSVSATIHCYY